MAGDTTERATTISITLYSDEIAALEEMSQQEGRSRSNMLRRLIVEGAERRAEAEQAA